MRLFWGLLVLLAVISRGQAIPKVRVSELLPSANLNSNQKLEEFSQLESVEEEEGSGEFLLDDEDQDIEGSSVGENGEEEEEEDGVRPFGHDDENEKNDDKENDFHFAENDKLNIENKDDELYEYYSEYYDEDEDYDLDEDEEEDDDEDGMDLDEEDYDDDEEDEDEEEIIPENPRVVIYESSPPVVSRTPSSEDSDSPNSNSVLNISYLYVLLASAVLSFSFAILVFILCRKSSLERRQKKKLLPFILSSGAEVSKAQSQHPELYYHPVALNPGSLPPQSIVKNQGRVPPTTRDFLHNQHYDPSEVELLHSRKASQH